MGKWGGNVDIFCNQVYMEFLVVQGFTVKSKWSKCLLHFGITRELSINLVGSFWLNTHISNCLFTLMNSEKGFQQHNPGFCFPECISWDWIYWTNCRSIIFVSSVAEDQYLIDNSSKCVDLHQAAGDITAPNNHLPPGWLWSLHTAQRCSWTQLGSMHIWLLQASSDLLLYL